MGTTAGTTRRKNQARTREVFEAAGAANERARLRPLLERCLAALALWQTPTLNERDLLADLRRELGLPED